MVEPAPARTARVDLELHDGSIALLAIDFDWQRGNGISSCSARSVGCDSVAPGSLTGQFDLTRIAAPDSVWYILAKREHMAVKRRLVRIIASVAPETSRNRKEG